MGDRCLSMVAEEQGFGCTSVVLTCVWMLIPKGSGTMSYGDMRRLVSKGCIEAQHAEASAE
jgi:hypothetical protein